MALETMTATEQMVRAICEIAPGEGAGEGIANELMRTHRTEQQNFWRAIYGAAVRTADHADQYGSDLRNEASVKLCRLIRDQYVGAFPYV